MLTMISHVSKLSWPFAQPRTSADISHSSQIGRLITTIVCLPIYHAIYLEMIGIIGLRRIQSVIVAL